MKASIFLRILPLTALMMSLNACALVIPWQMAWGGWREGIPHDPLIYQGLTDTLSRQAASGALIGLREKPFRLKDVKVMPGPASDSVLLMASLPFEPPKSHAEDDEAYYKDAVLPVFVKVRWVNGSLTHYDVNARIIRTPFHANWVEVYDATGSAEAAPAFLMRRSSDLRSADEARQMDAAMDALCKQLVETVRADLPWVVEEVSK